MLIKFSCENFLSFRERTEFSLIARKEDQEHPHHVVKGESNEYLPLVCSALLYGANASGKSNLIKAMAFARRLIVEGTEKNKNIVFDVIPSHVDRTKADKA